MWVGPGAGHAIYIDVKHTDQWAAGKMPKRRFYTVKFEQMAVEGNLRKQVSCIDTTSQLISLAVHSP